MKFLIPHSIHDQPSNSTAPDLIGWILIDAKLHCIRHNFNFQWETSWNLCFCIVCQIYSTRCFYHVGYTVSVTGKGVQCQQFTLQCWDLLCFIQNLWKFGCCTVCTVGLQCIQKSGMYTVLLFVLESCKVIQSMLFPEDRKAEIPAVHVNSKCNVPFKCHCSVSVYNTRSLCSSCTVLKKVRYPTVSVIWYSIYAYQEDFTK